MTKVTTIVPAYNQEKFIDNALLSACRQIAQVDHEILVSSDGSSDGTRDKIRTWVRAYPGLVGDLSEDHNVGISGNFKRLFGSAGGEYVAILEGDDLWTSSQKLEKQVAFLEEHRDCAMVFSMIRVRRLPSMDEFLLPRQTELSKEKLDGSDFLAEPTMNLIANFSSCMIRTEVVRRLPDRLFRERFNEIALAFFVERYGKIGFIKEALSIYHMHDAGVWTGSSREQQLRSGLATRLMALDVADPKYADSLTQIIDEKYWGPLAQITES